MSSLIPTTTNLETGLDDPLSRLQQPGSDEDLRTWRLPDEGIDLEAVVRSLTLQAVERSGANVSRAARMLGISRATLRYRLRKYGVIPCRG